MMCESMCVGNLKMTFVPEPAVQPKPRERIKARSVYDFRLGDRIMCVVGSALGKDTVYIVTEVDKERMLFCTNGICANETIPHYDNRFVLVSETIIEDDHRVVGYVNGPCPAPKPKTMKFNDVPNWSVFTSDKTYHAGMQFLKISPNHVLRWDDQSRYDPSMESVSLFTNQHAYNSNRNLDSSWGLYNNSANCTVIGSVQFG